MAEYCRTRIPSPDMIFCSDSVRTKETAIYFSDAWNLNETSIHYLHEIYEASLNGLLKAVATTNTKIQHLALIGHNPGMTSLYNYLAADHEIENIPTCGVAHFDLQETSWENLIPRKAEMKCFITPKMLEQG